MDQKAVQPPSPLLDLPPELRNMIYEYTLIERRPIMLTLSEHSTDSHRLLEPALLATNNQLRNEGLPVYHGRNAFKCATLSAASVFIGNLGQLRAPMVQSLRNLRFRRGKRFCRRMAEEWIGFTLPVVLRNGLRKEAVRVTWNSKGVKAWKRLVDVPGMLELMEACS